MAPRNAAGTTAATGCRRITPATSWISPPKTGLSRTGSGSRRLPAQEELADLGGDEDREARADADQLLVTGQLGGVENALEETQLGGEDDRAGRQQRAEDERPVVERVQAEHRMPLVAGGEREHEVADGEGGQRHRAREHFALVVLGSG